MHGTINLLSRVSSWLTGIAGVSTFAMMALVGADVLFRAFGGGVPGTLEIVANYLMVLVTFLPLARVERLDATITVDAFYTTLGAPTQRALLVFAAIFSTVIYGMLAWFTWIDAVNHFEVRSYVFAVKLHLPTWPGYFLLPIGLGLAALVTLIRIYELAAGTYEPEYDFTSEIDGPATESEAESRP